MDRRLQILQALYGEAEDDAYVRRLLAEEPELWQEYQALSEVKFALDHRRPLRPAPDLLDAVMATAGDAGSSDRRRRRDRAPVARRAARVRAAAIVGAASAFLLLLAVGLRQAVPPSNPGATRSASNVPAAATPAGGEEAPEPLDVAATRPAPPQGVPAAAPSIQSAAAEAQATPAGRLATAMEDAPVAEEDLQWDASEDLVEMHRRIETLRASIGGAWDQVAVPLEQVPASESGRSLRGLQPASQQRPADGRSH